MQLLYILLILLVATRVLGELAARAGQVQIVGELLAGILIGIAAQRFSGAFPVFANLGDNEIFEGITDLSVFFLMLLAGLEMRPRDLVETSKVALPVALGGIVVPLGLGIAVGWGWLPDSDLKLAQALVLGLALAITAVPVSVSVLLQLRQLNSKVGRVIVGAAVSDDVLSLVLLAVIMSVAVNQEPLSMAMLGMLGLEVASFFAITVFAGRFLLPRLGNWIKHFKLDHIEISFVITWALGLALLAEALELHFAVGAFTAGLLFTRHSIDRESYENLRDRTEAFTMGFLGPLFFASIGLHLDLRALTEIPIFLGAIVVAAFIGKFVGAGAIARASGFDTRQSLAVGAGMNARGAVALIVADIALQAGVFDGPTPRAPEAEYLFSAIVIMAIATTVVSPVLLRYSLREKDS